MPRPPKWRRVEFVPQINCFKPVGIPLREMDEIRLPVEELEAIRLKDYEGLEQEACAERMRISRPTFHRVLHSARLKIAEALITGKAIRIEGGRFRMAIRNVKCVECDHEWKIPWEESRTKSKECPECNSNNLERLQYDGKKAYWERCGGRRRGRGHNK